MALLLGYSETYLPEMPSWFQETLVNALAKIAQWKGERIRICTNILSRVKAKAMLIRTRKIVAGAQMQNMENRCRRWRGNRCIDPLLPRINSNPNGRRLVVERASASPECGIIRLYTYGGF